MNKINKLISVFIIELWVFFESILHKIGFEKYSECFYSFLCKKSPRFYKMYNLFLAAFYRKNYSKFKLEKNLVFLDCFWGRKVGDHPYAIYREILKDTSKNWRFIWVKNVGITAPKDVADNPYVTFVEHRSVGYTKALLKAGVLVCNSNFLPYFTRRQEQIFINTWHGIPLKTLGLDTPQPLTASLNTQRNFNQATVIPMSSCWAAEKVVGSYGAGLAMERVFETGSPRIDLMLNADINKIRKRLGIASDKKIILYAPTWRGAIGSVSENIKEQVEAIKTIQYSTSHEYVLYVSLHHLTRNALGGRPAGISYVPDDIDMSEFLSIVDVLVSDYSSIFIDYLALDRPIVLHVPDLETYKKERGLLLDIEDLPVVISYKSSDLISVFEKLKQPSEISSFSYYKALWLPNEDGNATKRCWEIAKNKLVNKSTDARQNVLIYGGMLASNGITQSLMNLLDVADKERYRFWVAFNVGFDRRNSVGVNNLLKIKELAEVILIPQQARMLMTERLAASFFKKFNFYLYGVFEGKLESYSSYEARRLFSDFYFDRYLDFSGYSYYWSLLSPSINAGKRIVYLHSDMYEEWNNKDRKMSRLGAIIKNYKNYDFLVSVSNACYEQNNKKLTPFISGKSKMVAVPNSFNGDKVIELSQHDLAEVSSSTSAFLKNNKKSTVFITISRLSPEKNLSTLLHAFKKIREVQQDALLIIVGDGIERKKLEYEVGELALTDSVCFAGFMVNPYPLLLASDCLVFPSKYEGQGLVLLEALTLGKYCIATDMPASREILKAGYGDLVEPSVDAFSKALLAYCQEKSSAKNFDYEAYSKNAIQQFDKLLSGQLD